MVRVLRVRLLGLSLFFFFFFDQPNAVTHHTPPHTFSTSSDVSAEAHNALNGQGITHVVELGAEGIFSPVV